MSPTGLETIFNTSCLPFNKLYYKGKKRNIFTSVDKICAMRNKLPIWIRKVKEGNLDSFYKTAECELKSAVCLLIINHLTLLQKETLLSKS